MPFPAIALKKLKSPSALFFLCVTVIAIFVGVFSKPYFTERVFHLNGHTYKLHSQENQRLVYHSSSGSAPVEISIHNLEHERMVYLDGGEYNIRKITVSPYETKYIVTYPAGQRYEVVSNGYGLMSFDSKGELVPEFYAYSGDTRILGESEETYFPSALVTAAYEKYHYTLGEPVYLYLALALLIYGWCGFRYRKFQDVAYWISLRWIWTRNPEPSDFYYIMCKVAGVLCMVASLFLAMKAYQ